MTRHRCGASHRPVGRGSGLRCCFRAGCWGTWGGGKRGRKASAQGEQAAQWAEGRWKVETVHMAQTKHGSSSCVSLSTWRVPSSGHNLGGPRSGDGAAEEGGSQELQADTHGLALGALFAFEASYSRFALGETEAGSHMGSSPRTCPHLQTPLKAPPTPATIPHKGLRCEHRKGGRRGLTPGVLGVHSEPYRLTFRAQRTSRTLRARWTTGPGEAGGASDARSTLSA